MNLRARPLTLKQANELVTRWHRHHKPAVGTRFCIAAEADGRLVGAAIVGRPVARETDQYEVAEVTRLVTDGTRNACSFLYQRSARAAAAMGYRSIQTFTRESESGASLRAAGWTRVRGGSDGTGWESRQGRLDLGEPTVKWERKL